MGGEGDSGRRQEERDAAEASDAARPGIEPDDGSDWLESFRDVRFSWDTPGHEHESRLPSGDDWLFSFERQPEREGGSEGAEADGAGDVDTAVEADAAVEADTAGEVDAAGEADAAGEVDRPVVDLPDDRGRAPSDVAGPPTLGRVPRSGRSRRRVALVAALVVLLIAVGVVVGVALISRDSGTKASSSRRPTSPVARSAVTTTTAPASAPTTVPAPASPAPFTVQSTCRGQGCSLGVHDGPSTGAKSIGSLRNGDVVQVACSTHGDLVHDTDTGQQSDVWLRFADRPGYASAVYLQGPPVPDCR